MAQRLASPGNTRRIDTDKPWARYQRRQSDPEVRLWAEDPDDPNDRVWADGVDIDPDTIVAVEVKLVENPKRSMYQGDLPQPFLDKLLSGFDAELVRYGRVIRHKDNPVGRLRLVVSTEAAAAYLGARARRLLGNDIDLDVQVRPERDSS